MAAVRAVVHLRKPVEVFSTRAFATLPTCSQNGGTKAFYLGKTRTGYAARESWLPLSMLSFDFTIGPCYRPLLNKTNREPLSPPNLHLLAVLMLPSFRALFQPSLTQEDYPGLRLHQPVGTSLLSGAYYV